MALLSAKQLKHRETGERLIDIGGGDEVLIRRPDVQVLVLNQALPLPLLSSVVKTVSEWSGASISTMSEDALNKSADTLAFIDLWVTHALVSPRVSADGAEGTIRLSDLTLSTKMLIFRSSLIIGEPDRKAAQEAAEEFPENGSGAGAGPDVQAVRTEAVADIAHA